MEFRRSHLGKSDKRKRMDRKIVFHFFHDFPLDTVGVSGYNMTTTGGDFSMNAAISIRPSRDLRSNYSQISALARQNPVAITVNGKEDTVVMSHESFMEQQNYIAEMEARLQVYAHLAQAEDDVKLGRVQPIEDVRRNLLRELDDWAP